MLTHVYMKHARNDTLHVMLIKHVPLRYRQFSQVAMFTVCSGDLYITENTIGSFIERAVISCNLVKLGHRAFKPFHFGQMFSIVTIDSSSNNDNVYH